MKSFRQQTKMSNVVQRVFYNYLSSIIKMYLKTTLIENQFREPTYLKRNGDPVFSI
jgi:hypothetical protein